MTNAVYEAIQDAVKIMKQKAFILNSKKRKTQNQIWELAILCKEYVVLEGYLEETEKEQFESLTIQGFTL